MAKIFLSSSTPATLCSILAEIDLRPEDLRVAFINTAAEYETGDKLWLAGSLENFQRQAGYVQEYTLTGKNLGLLEAELAEFNFYHLSGGNTFFLLEQIRKSGFDTFIRQRLTEGAIYSGESAGAIVAGSNAEPIKKIEGKFDFSMNDYRCMGLVDVLVLPHWGVNAFREAYQRAFDDIYNSGLKTICLAENQYLYSDNGKLLLEMC